MIKLSCLAKGHDFRFMRAFVMAPHFAWLELCLARRNSGGAQGIKTNNQAKSFQLKLSLLKDLENFPIPTLASLVVARKISKVVVQISL